MLIPGSLTKRIPELDFSGEVADANGSSEFKVGDPVIGMINALHALRNGQGTLGSYVLTPDNGVVHRPPNVSAIEAAGLILCGYTAYHYLFGLAKLEEGQSVFVNGGSTGVGLFAIQIAKAHGCR